MWLEPAIEIARAGRSLNRGELNRAVRIVQANQERLREAWHAHRSQAG
ncbi:MAG: hypothetical protein KJZ93_06430 [Caldilineaceae bacterium]|nr:hypothetical protein [Caldilineaceae bacterium]